MHLPWLFNAPPAALRCLLLFAARCLQPFCVGCCSVLPLCVAWSSALAARLVASRWSSAATPQPAIALSRRPLPAASCSVASPGQQHLPDSSSLQRPCQPLRRSAPASNKPHSAEKSTPVWLAIWRTWAGFANSQLQRATFRSTYLYMCPSALLPPWSCCSDRRKSFGPSAPIAYATSVSPPNEAAAWPGAAFLQITARTNPCSRHLWGTLARAVASI